VLLGFAMRAGDQAFCARLRRTKDARAPPALHARSGQGASPRWRRVAMAMETNCGWFTARAAVSVRSLSGRRRACPLPATLKVTKPRQAGVWLGEGADRVCRSASNQRPSFAVFDTAAARIKNPRGGGRRAQYDESHFAV
jgi:hypothetical protein